VNGPEVIPLFKWLKKEQQGAAKGAVLGDDIVWNFTKFLISRDGKVLERYGPTTSPLSMTSDIEAALQQPRPATSKTCLALDSASAESSTVERDCTEC